MVRHLLAWAAFFLTMQPAAAAPPEIADILTLRDIGGHQSGLALSPDGRTVAAFERDTLIDEDRYRYRLLVAPVDGRQARYVADGGDATLRTTTGRFQGAIDDRIPAWSSDGQWLAYIARHNDRIELWRVRPNGGGNRRLLGGDRDVARFAWLGVDEIVVELYPSRTDLEARTARDRRQGFFADDRFEPRYSLIPYPDLSGGRTIVVIDVRGGRQRDATVEEAQTLRPATGYGAPAGQVAFDQEGDLRVSVAPATPGDPAALPALALYVTRAGETIRCTLAECSGRMSGAWIAGDNRIVFQRREGHGPSDNALYAWNLQTNTVELLRRADELLLGCDDTETALVCLQESPAQPRRLVAMSLSSGQLTVIHDPNPQWERFETTRIERLDVTDGYGNEGFAHLVWPRGYQEGQLYPLVIVQYRSRGFLRGGTGGEYPIHALAGRGYFVLSVDRTDNYRLMAELPPAEAQVRTELDGSELRMKQTQLEALLRQIADRHIVDPSRIAITGFSDGSETAYWMLTRTGLIAVAVVSNSPVDPSSYPLISENFRRELRAVGTTGPWPGSPDPWATWWRENSALYQADQIRAPLLMNLSDNEALTGFPLFVRLRELGRPTEMYVYPGEHHVKWRPQHQLAAQRRALDWIDFWLRGVESDDPEEPGRLERWRGLRARHAASAD
jgi:dipeptidyl aminopeptidase/acylaminoacyl peptidase